MCVKSLQHSWPSKLRLSHQQCMNVLQQCTHAFWYSVCLFDVLRQGHLVELFSLGLLWILWQSNEFRIPFKKSLLYVFLVSLMIPTRMSCPISDWGLFLSLYRADQEDNVWVSPGTRCKHAASLEMISPSDAPYRGPEAGHGPGAGAGPALKEGENADIGRGDMTPIGSTQY